MSTVINIGYARFVSSFDRGENLLCKSLKENSSRDFARYYLRNNTTIKYEKSWKIKLISFKIVKIPDHCPSYFEKLLSVKSWKKRFNKVVEDI